MNQYQELYKKKRMSAEQALELIQDGDSMFSAQAAAEPQAILSKLQHLKETGVKGTTLNSCLPIQYYDAMKDPEMAGIMSHNGWFFTAGLRDAQKKKLVSAVPQSSTSVLRKSLQRLQAEGRRPVVLATVSPMELTYLPTGQKIMFFGLDDPGNLKSIKLPFGYVAYVHFEELDQFDGPEQIRNVEQSTLRGGSFSFTFKSFNPPAMARNWANRYVLEKKPGQMVHHSTYLTAPPEWLGPRFIADAEHLKNTNPTGYRHEYLGEVVGSGTQVFENLQLRAITDAEIGQFDRVTNGVDWGWYPDPWAWNRMHYDAARRTLYLFDELTRNRTGNADTAALVKGRVPAGELLIADSAEEKSVSDYRSYGLNCRASEKGPGSVAYSMKWLQSLAAIVIDPGRCPDTAQEFSEYEYERDGKTGEVLQGYPDAANHHIDAVRYGTNKIWKRRGQ